MTSVRRALALAGVVSITAAVSTGAVAYAVVLTAARVLGRRRPPRHHRLTG